MADRHDAPKPPLGPFDARRLPLASSARTRALDAAAIAAFEGAGLRLMEVAGTASWHLLMSLIGLDTSSRVLVLAGHGNNGGDAFVVARGLLGAGVPVTALGPSETGPPKTDDAATMFEHFLACGGRVAPLTLETLEHELGAGPEVIVDGLLGTGLDGPVRGPLVPVIERLRSREGRPPVLALDLPSGVAADRIDLPGPAIEATWTVTFATRKPCSEGGQAQAALGELYGVPLPFPPAAWEPGNPE